MRAGQEQHVRRFGGVLHFAILRGAPGVDVQAEILGGLLAAIPEELEGIEPEHQAVQGFWPLNRSS